MSIRGTEMEKRLLVYADLSSYNVYSWKDVTIDLAHSKSGRPANGDWRKMPNDVGTDFTKTMRRTFTRTDIIYI